MPRLVRSLWSLCARPLMGGRAAPPPPWGGWGRMRSGRPFKVADACCGRALASGERGLRAVARACLCVREKGEKELFFSVDLATTLTGRHTSHSNKGWQYGASGCSRVLRDPLRQPLFIRTARRVSASRTSSVGSSRSAVSTWACV